MLWPLSPRMEHLVMRRTALVWPLASLRDSRHPACFANVLYKCMGYKCVSIALEWTVKQSLHTTGEANAQSFPVLASDHEVRVGQNAYESARRARNLTAWWHGCGVRASRAVVYRFVRRELALPALLHKRTRDHALRSIGWRTFSSPRRMSSCHSSAVPNIQMDTASIDLAIRHRHRLGFVDGFVSTHSITSDCIDCYTTCVSWYQPSFNDDLVCLVPVTPVCAESGFCSISTASIRRPANYEHDIDVLPHRFGHEWSSFCVFAVLMFCIPMQ